MTQQMSGEDKAREVLRRISGAGPNTESQYEPWSICIEAMLAFREEGRLAALDAAAGVARGWPHHPAAIEIVRRIEALKDQK